MPALLPDVRGPCKQFNPLVDPRLTASYLGVRFHVDVGRAGDKAPSFSALHLRSNPNIGTFLFSGSPFPNASHLVLDYKTTKTTIL